MKKMIDNDILDTISKSTFKNNSPLWLKNILENEKRFGFKNTIREIKIKKSKSIVLAAGPESKKQIEGFKIIKKERDKITVVACGTTPVVCKNL